MAARFLFAKAYEWYTGFQERFLEKIDVIYDRNEQYLKNIDVDWRSPRIRKRHPFWGLVNTVAAADAKLTPPLQAADMLAWSSNRLLAGPAVPEIDEVCQAIINGPATWNLILNEENLRQTYGRVELPPWHR